MPQANPVVRVNGIHHDEDSPRTLWKLVRNIAKTAKLRKNVAESTDLRKIARLCSNENIHVATMAVHYVSIFMKSMNSSQKVCTLSQVMLWSKHAKYVDTLVNFILTHMIEDYWNQQLKSSYYKSIYDDASLIRTDPLDFIFLSHPISADYFFRSISSIDPTLRNEIFGCILERFIFSRDCEPYNYCSLRLSVWRDCVYKRNDKYLNDYFLVWNQDYGAEMLAKNICLHIEHGCQNESTSFLFALNAFVAQCRENAFQPDFWEISVKLLKASDRWAQVIASAYLVLNIDTISPTSLPVYLKFFERIMLKESVSKEVFLLMLAAIVPIREERSLPPHLKLALSEFESNIYEAMKYSFKTKANSSEIMFHYALHSNNSLLEARQIILLLQELKTPEKRTTWFEKHCERVPRLKSLRLLLYTFFHFGSAKQKRSSFETLRKGHILKFNRCLYQCKRESDPRMKIELLEHLLTISKTEEEKKIVVKLIAFFSKNPKIHKIMLRKLITIVHLNRNYINFWPPIFLSLFRTHNDLLSQLLVIEKLLENRVEKFGSDFTPKINFVLNKWKKLPRKEMILPVAFRCLRLMCEKGIVSIRKFWEPLVKRFGSSKDPVALKCLFSFLAIVPGCIIPKTKSPAVRASYLDESGEIIIYKSARILWHFVRHNSKLSESAARALMNYELDVFDFTFLDPVCQEDHNDTLISGQDRLKVYVNSLISGKCWICLLDNAPTRSVQMLFIELIEKYDDTFSRGANIQILYDSLAMHFIQATRTQAKVNPQNQLLILCMNLLGAQWKKLGRIHIRPDAILRLIKGNDDSIREIVFRMIRVQCSFNSATVAAFNDWALSQNITDCRSFYLLVVPTLLRLNLPDYSAIIAIAQLGYNEYFFKDKIKSVQIYNAVISCLRDHGIQSWPKSIVLQTLLKLWLVAPVKSEGAHMMSQLLAMFKKRLTHSLPTARLSDESILKTVQLCEDAAIKSKSLNAYSKCFEIAIHYKKFRGVVMKSFEYVLSRVPYSVRNSSWVNNFIQIRKCKTEDEANFLFEALVIAADRISTTRQFSTTDNFTDAVDRLPLALHEIISNLKNTETMMPHLAKWLTDSKLKPIYTEALMLSMINLKNSSVTPIDIRQFVCMLDARH